MKNDFWTTIISSFLGALLALAGAFFMFRIQEYHKLKNAKTFILIELTNIETILTKTMQSLNSQNLFGTVQVMHNKIYYDPCDFDSYKVDLSQLNQNDFLKICQFYRKIKEFEEVRSFMIKRKEEGVDLESLSNKSNLPVEERTTKMFMDIYENYFLNIDNLVREINELKKILE